jgi:hypothetical protein
MIVQGVSVGFHFHSPIQYVILNLRTLVAYMYFSGILTTFVNRKGWMFMELHRRSGDFILQ